ncbi:MAG: hypothetical protein WBA79_21580 [Mycobacterium sp.]
MELIRPAAALATRARSHGIKRQAERAASPSAVQAARGLTT